MRWVLLTLATLGFCGCDTGGGVAPSAPASRDAPPALGDPVADAPPAASPRREPRQSRSERVGGNMGLALPGGAAPRRRTAPSKTPSCAPARTRPAPGESVKATAGVGKKGRGYGGGFITEPIRQKFRIEQRLILDVQIPHAMDLYTATNGKPPKDHDTFMKDIIKANSLRLPELPEGETYFYDAKRKELMVRRPAR